MTSCIPTFIKTRKSCYISISRIKLHSFCSVLYQCFNSWHPLILRSFAAFSPQVNKSLIKNHAFRSASSTASIGASLAKVHASLALATNKDTSNSFHNHHSCLNSPFLLALLPQRLLQNHYLHTKRLSRAFFGVP